MKNKVVSIFLILAVLILSVSCMSAAQDNPQRDFETESYRLAEEKALFDTVLAEKTEVVYEMDKEYAPYVLQDVFYAQQSIITDITIPVYATGSTDSKGNFIFTVRVMDIVNGYFLATDMEYHIAVNAKKYNLKPWQEDINRFIDIDVVSYGIEVGENQVLAFSDQNDTISMFSFMADLRTLAALGKIHPQALGFFLVSGRQYNSNILPIGFSRISDGRALQEKEQEEYYAQLIASLRQKYSGKRLSVLGDSISTFGGVTNNPRYNSTIYNNAVYYKASDKRMPSVDFLYWKRLADDLGMEICVPNAWSGSRVYGKSDADFLDSGVLRATELDNDNGTPADPSDDIKPNLILVFLGINDLHNIGIGKAREIRDMTAQAGEDEAKLKEMLDKWFAYLLEKTDDANRIEPNVNITSFDQAYALMLYRMKREYPDAQIIATDYFANGHKSFTPEAEKAYCLIVRTLCSYFGIECLQWSQSIGITRSNARFLTVDPTANSLHPGPYGQLLMERQILEKLASI